MYNWAKNNSQENKLFKLQKIECSLKFIFQLPDFQLSKSIVKRANQPASLKNAFDSKEWIVVYPMVPSLDFQQMGS
jgi:chlorite dismutase